MDKSELMVQLKKYALILVAAVLMGLWTFRNHQAKKKVKVVVKEGRYQLLDVRTQQEYLSHNIPGSIHIPVDELASNFSKLDKNVPVIVYCASGMRSAAAKLKLEADGFKTVINGGGIGSVQAVLAH